MNARNSSSTKVNYLNYVLAGFVSTDIDGRILKTNSTFLSMIDCEKDQANEKMYFHDYLSKGSQIYYQTHFIPLLKMHSEVKEINLDIKSRNGVVPVLVNSSIIDIQGKTYIHTTLFEITRRETYERELFYEKKKAESLAQKLQKSNEIIEAQRNELAELNKQKDKIVGVMSHDFRSPLVELQSMMVLLTDYINDFTKEEMVNMLAKAKDSLSNTITLAENLIEWSMVQLEKSNTPEEAVNLNQIIEEVLTLQLQTAIKKNISISKSVDHNIKIGMPSNHIALVLRNLLTNAIKFTPENGAIKIAGYENSLESILIVQDSGAGMDPDLIESFQSNGRIKSSKGTRGEKGFGLGLFLVKDTIRSHNGNIEVKSEANKGTTFKVSIPKT
ncbi:PAS domain-containing sensor histidine kinase [Marivirga salinae]|uniref:histidine kinase n=1 Tax=Marivirga salinarum TaxID=3059078 RepID=A0AA51NC96_9BACT|nr:PAS domain-containing sensor histidine kinase [Marivirga sp. BDSF4-3]WMN12742.1 PAS domain-containing sensor histidine kinase [Marivirga sp. BDSF4-3]